MLRLLKNILMLLHLTSLWRAAMALPGLTCTTGYFPCNDNTTCVEQKLNCNGQEDCFDGSDEMNCEDDVRRLYFNQIFSKRPDEDREKNTALCNLTVIPKFCNCSSRNIYCVHQGLTEIPKNIDSTLMELDLSGNQFGEFIFNQPGYFPYLQTLIMTSSGISSITPESFLSFPNLHILYLSGNSLRHLPNNAFTSNSQLQAIFLSHNPLEELASTSFSGLHNLQELDLRGCMITELSVDIFKGLGQLVILLIDGNFLSTLHQGIFSSLGNLSTLSLSKNALKYVDLHIFEGLVNIRSLSLAMNLLKSLNHGSFGNLTKLEKLDLHGNRLESIGLFTFTYLQRLQSLNLKDNRVRKLKKGMFNGLPNLHHIYFDEFFMCSYALNVRVCEPHGDGISSLANLLDNVFLRVSVWVVSIISCFGNCFVLIGRLLIKEKNEVHSFYIKNLALADMVMGIYLLIIAAQDIVFRGVYIQHEETWRQSWQCALCGFLNTTSSEASVFILTVITADRYLSIVYPLSLKRRTLRFARSSMLLLWSLAVFLAAFPLLGLSYFGDEYYGGNGVCLPLHIHEPYVSAWEYSTALFCGVNTLAFIIITYAYFAMFVTITTSKNGLRSSQQQQDRSIAKRFAFIVGTDFLCWMPVVLIKVLALAGVKIGDDLYAWVAIFLLPVNAALNPILFTLTTKVFKQNVTKTLRTITDRKIRTVVTQDSTLLSSLAPTLSFKRSNGVSINEVTLRRELSPRQTERCHRANINNFCNR